MKDGEEGICHKGGWCKPATMEPDCGPEGKLLSMMAKFALFFSYLTVADRNLKIVRFLLLDYLKNSN